MKAIHYSKCVLLTRDLDFPTNPSPNSSGTRQPRRQRIRANKFSRKYRLKSHSGYPHSLFWTNVPTTLPKTTPIPEPDILKNLPKPNIPYPSRRDNQKSHDKASNKMEKIFQIFQDLRFDISFVDALLLMPRFAPTIKSLRMNKKSCLSAIDTLNEKIASAMLLKKLPKACRSRACFYSM
ncbi:hypothetical protein Tco_0906504 [Tanacetum coccineum]|uniref:Reverse transcriptase domain-containing protein n=1 Tax=Tanacetum coccineum TaxID=301880 RepID=A0ABQ5CMV1_9ASTR